MIFIDAVTEKQTSGCRAAMATVTMKFLFSWNHINEFHVMILLW